MTTEEIGKKLIVKANRLIETSTSLTTFEQRLLLYTTSLINKDDTELKEYEIRLPTFRKVVGITQSYSNLEIKRRLVTLLEKVVEIRDSENDDQYILTHWFSSAEVDLDRSIIKLKIDPALAPYLLQLKASFTSYQLKQVIRFNNKYAFKLYELLKQYQTFGVRTITVKDLRYFLGLKDDQYKVLKNFKKRVLNPALKEINEKSDLVVGITQRKEGREVISFKFSFTALRSKQQESINPDKYVFIPIKHRMNQAILEMVKKYEGRYSLEYVKWNVEYANKHSKTNYRHFLSKALEGNWGQELKDEYEAKKKHDQQLIEWQKQQEAEDKERHRKAEAEKEEVLEKFRSLSPLRKSYVLKMMDKEQNEFEKKLIKDVRIWLFYCSNPSYFGTTKSS